MGNYSKHKNIKIFLVSLFFAVGVGVFALVANAFTYPYSLPATYTIATLPDAFDDQKTKDDFSALDTPPSKFYRGEVVSEVNKAFGTSGIERGVYDTAVQYGKDWNKAKEGVELWKAYEATWVGAVELTDKETGEVTKIPAHYTGKQPNAGYSEDDIWHPAKTAYTSLDEATAAEAEKRASLVDADQAYTNTLNKIARDAIEEQLNKAKVKAVQVAEAAVTKKYNKCMANATGSTYEDIPADNPIVYHPDTSLSPAGLTLYEEKLACNEKKAVEMKEASAAGDVLGGKVKKEADDTKMIGGTSGGTSTPGTSSSGGPAALTAEQQAQAAALLANQEMASPKELELLAEMKEACSPLSGEGVMACFAVLPYHFIYVPSSWLMIIAGYMFDASLSLSIDRTFVNQDFVKESWTVIRDFSNMLFIFILLFTGIQTILGIGDWRKTVLHIVIIALLINFSLFFTKVVIDAGNILAVGVYQSMGATKTAGTGMLKSGSIPERNLSETLVASFSPQKFLAKTGKVNGWNAIIVFLIAAAVNAVAAYVLFKVALVFIGRLLAFWVLMILSPFAFISFTLKGDANIFGWYTSTLISQAFVAPVFLFLLYLVMTVISAGDGIMSAFAK